LDKFIFPTETEDFSLPFYFIFMYLKL